MSVAHPQAMFVDVADARSDRVASRWPTWTCVLISVLFMFATDSVDAVNTYRDVPKNVIGGLSIAVEGGRGARQIAFVLLGCWGALALLRPARRAFRLWAPMAFAVALFVGWAGASVIWSADRDFTVKRLSVLACCVLAVAGFVKERRLRDIVLLALVGGTLQMIGSIAADLAWATNGIGTAGYRLSGLQHPNHSGLNAAFLLLASLAFFDFTRLKRFLALAAVATVVLLLTRSRSSLFAGAAACVLMLVLRCPPRRLMTIGVVSAIVLSLVLAIEASGALGTAWTNVIYLGRTDAEQTQLTGRPMIWAAALEVFGSDPTRMLTGAGYSSFWTPETAEYVSARLQFGISEGHNAYFDTLLTLGVVGVGCVAVVLLMSVGRWSWFAWNAASPWPAFAASIAVFAIVHGLTESTLVDPNFATFISYACIATLAFRSPRTKGPACAS